MASLNIYSDLLNSRPKKYAKHKMPKNTSEMSLYLKSSLKNVSLFGKTNLRIGEEGKDG